MKILLVCCAGMSTSMLVKRMSDVAEKKGIDADISACPLGEAQGSFKNYDIVMLGPQVRYEKKKVENEVQGALPVVDINMKDYGMMNGEKVLETAIETINNFKK